MIIEIRGTGCYNKGAELMTHAIVQHFRQQTTKCNPTFAVTTGFGSYEARAKLGLYTKHSSARWGRAKLLDWLTSPAYRRAHGIIKPAEIDIILDASGFAFSDQWGPEKAERLAEQVRKWKRSPQHKLILLPQAVGPFTTARIQSAFREIQAQADLIFVRDHQSYAYLRELGGSLEHVRIVPDFTLVVKGSIPPYYQPTARDMLIVPNVRMLDKTGAEEKANYMAFLVRCLHEAAQRELRPIVLFHAAQDQELLPQLQAATSNLQVIYEDDPLHLKGIIGTAFLVVSSRFHALANALSQGVPVIGTGWSHKYQMLFEDYDCAPALVSTQNTAALPALFTELTEQDTRRAAINKIRARDSLLKQQVHAMWQEIDATIDFK